MNAREVEAAALSLPDDLSRELLKDAVRIALPLLKAIAAGRTFVVRWALNGVIGGLERYVEEEN